MAFLEPLFGLSGDAALHQRLLDIVVRRIERGQLSPSLRSLAKLAAGMEISLHSLFGGYEAPSSFLADRICDLLAERPNEDVASAHRVIVALLGV